VNKYYESHVGSVLSQNIVPRKDLFVQTKFVSLPHHGPFSPPYPKYEGQNCTEALQLSLFRSLENLQTNYVDAFLINAPELDAESLTSLLEQLRQFQKQGLVRYGGVCNIRSLRILTELHDAFPDTLQIVQNPLHSPWDPRYKLPRYCRLNGIQYNTFDTLNGSARVLESDSIKRISHQIRSTPHMVFLQYCIQSGITPLGGSRYPHTLKSILSLANGEWPELSDKDMTLISRLMAGQKAINARRRVSLMQRQSKQVRREKGLEKMKADQQQQLLETIEERDLSEQKLVEIAKARARALGQQLMEQNDTDVANKVESNSEQWIGEEVNPKKLPAR
jgi:diketogulonate reductase-like aldo/keto reductase